MGTAALVQVVLLAVLLVGIGAFMARRIGGAGRALRAKERERAAMLLSEVQQSAALRSATPANRSTMQVGEAARTPSVEVASDAGGSETSGAGAPGVPDDLGAFFVGQVKAKPLFAPEPVRLAATAPVTLSPVRTFDGAFGQASQDLAEALRNAAVLVENAALHGGGTHSERAARVTGVVMQAVGALPLREVVAAAAYEDAFVGPAGQDGESEGGENIPETPVA